MDRPHEIHQGVVIRINRFGLGIIEEEPSTTRYVFTFDKIRGYRGESPREIGLKVGTWVEFTLKDEGRIATVTLKNGIDKRKGLW